MSCKTSLAFTAACFVFSCAWAQSSTEEYGLLPVKILPHTAVKNQAGSGTCWSFSTLSLVESQLIKSGIGEFDLSEMFTVRNIYTEKARNYILRQGSAQFGPGGLGNDVINAIESYGAMPEGVYSGLSLGQAVHDHSELDMKLKSYLDRLLSQRPIPSDWMNGFQSILDDYLGKVPESFSYKEKQYTPKTFAREVLNFKKQDYIFITSFTHHPFYSKFILEIPDNYGSESYWNIPLNEMTQVTTQAIQKGFSVMWDADISNSNFKQKEGFALHVKKNTTPAKLTPDIEEDLVTTEMRQQLFENLTTQDDHLMHIVGIEKSKSGKNFFLVKNSWGEVGPFKGFIHVSESYFALNTITIVLPKDAIDPSLISKLGLN